MVVVKLGTRDKGEEVILKKTLKFQVRHERTVEAVKEREIRTRTSFAEQVMSSLVHILLLKPDGYMEMLTGVER